MSARPVLRAASGGVARHRAQTLVIFLVLLVSTASATLGLALLTAANGPFDRAFAAQHGADAAVAVNSGRVTAASLAATRRLAGVTAAAGPFSAATVTLTSQGVSLPSSLLIGRSAPGGPLDDLTLVTGHWPQQPDQIVLSEGTGFFPGLGAKMAVTTGPGKPELTVVGIANSITNTADAWVLPSEIGALRPARAPAAAEMLYRFAAAGTAAQVRGDVAAVSAALPPGAVGGFSSWLSARQQATGTSAILAPFVEAFALIGLFMSVLIVANVVTGAVVASYRRIGVLKSIGFSPAQVVGAYVARVGVPAIAGCLIGVVAGDLLAIPVLRKSAASFGVGSQSVPLWVNVATPLAMCALVALTALGPALRAGRLSAVQAIALGHAPRQGRGYAVHRLAAACGCPGRSASAWRPRSRARPAPPEPWRPSCSASPPSSSLSAWTRRSPGQRRARTSPPPRRSRCRWPPGSTWQPGSRQDRAIVAALRAQPGTLRYVAAAQTELSAGALARQVNTEAFEGNSAWLGFGLISGRWYSGPGQVVVNTAYLNQTGLNVGQTTTISAGDRPITARIVGQAFVPGNQPALLTSVQTLGGTSASLGLDQYDVGLKPGVTPTSYAGALGRALGGGYAASGPGSGQFYLIADSLIAMLTLMMAVVAGLGVLNTVLLGTRDRVHDLGVFKAVGMTPRQTIAMVLCWVVAPAAVAAVIAIPVGMVLHSATADAMARAAYTGLPPSFLAVYRPAEIVLLALSGLAIAGVGALLPASWAARARTATALRAE